MDQKISFLVKLFFNVLKNNLIFGKERSLVKLEIKITVQFNYVRSFHAMVEPTQLIQREREDVCVSQASRENLFNCKSDAALTWTALTRPIVRKDPLAFDRRIRQLHSNDNTAKVGHDRWVTVTSCDRSLIFLRVQGHISFVELSYIEIFRIGLSFHKMISLIDR